VSRGLTSPKARAHDIRASREQPAEVVHGVVVLDAVAIRGVLPQRAVNDLQQAVIDCNRRRYVRRSSLNILASAGGEEKEIRRNRVIVSLSQVD